MDNLQNEAFEVLSGSGLNFRTEFSDALLKFDQVGLRIFLEYEKKAIRKFVEMWIEQQAESLREQMRKAVLAKGIEKFVSHAKRTFTDFALSFQKLEKSLAQMRKSRGGVGFQKNVLLILHHLGIPAETPTGSGSQQLRRIDIIIPDMQTALRWPDRAIFLTCKRTLRERWKQEVPQAMPNARFFLLTLDPSLPVHKANEIKDRGLIAFVPDQLKRLPELQGMDWIRPLNSLIGEIISYGKH